MTVTIDPEEHEVDALLEAVPAWQGKRVLEIGCGDGRLTFRYAALTGEIEAIDSNEEDIASARRATPPESAGRIRFHAIGIEEFEPGSDSPPFDLALFAYSL